jgi:hypothetical protein
MQRTQTHRSSLRVGWTTSLVAALLAALACAPAACAAPRLHAPATHTGPAREAAEAARVERYWTPARMRSARPLDLAMDGTGLHLRAARHASGAGASFLEVPTPEAPPFAVNGRLFVRQGELHGFCSATAINSPTRQLVLTAGHCVNSGPGERHHRAVWSNFLEFVPGFNGGVAPFGAFVARHDAVYAPKQWVKHGNPDFDMGAFLTRPNTEGANVADAVGGAAAIVFGLPRAEEFQSFGYPGETTHMQTCRSPYVGDDSFTYPFAGPPTQAIGCHWAPGASGGGWLIAEGTQIDGLTSYSHLGDRKRTFGPYFSPENIGKLIRGL